VRALAEALAVRHGPATGADTRRSPVEGSRSVASAVGLAPELARAGLASPLRLPLSGGTRDENSQALGVRSDQGLVLIERAVARGNLDRSLCLTAET
jgi:hypothetical protein